MIVDADEIEVRRRKEQEHLQQAVAFRLQPTVGEKSNSSALRTPPVKRDEEKRRVEGVQVEARNQVGSWDGELAADRKALKLAL